ncbi:hypothetical protein [Rheinheimera sp.]|uniref:hypothetical protein n=1 Tax=Rheinheimera sp. TaxID=1869214 RepID=UPI002FDCA61B
MLKKNQVTSEIFATAKNKKDKSLAALIFFKPTQKQSCLKEGLLKSRAVLKQPRFKPAAI